MKESHIEGVATHDDPESCAGAREGGGEALTGARAGQVTEPRNVQSMGADAVKRGGRQHVGHRQREMPAGPARSKTLCTCGISARENREICGPLGAMVRRAASGRP
jgi:RNA-directed DNA polymerase